MASKKAQMIEDLKEAGQYKRPVLAGEKIYKGYQKGITSYKPSAKEKRVSAVARKAISLLAPKGSMVRAITQSKKQKGDRGRGRPRGTYKARVLPSGKVVKVPTAVYKKMLSAEKAQSRLLRAQQMAQVQMQADQIAMQTDPRFQSGAEDQFLAEPDQLHEMEVARARQQAEMSQMYEEAPQSSVGQRIAKGFGDFGIGLSRLGQVRQQPQQQMVDEYGRPLQQQLFRPQPQGMGVRGEPRVTAVSERANLLNVPNRFNNPGESSILWNKRRSY